MRTKVEKHILMHAQKKAQSIIFLLQRIANYKKLCPAAADLSWPVHA